MIWLAISASGTLKLNYSSVDLDSSAIVLAFATATGWVAVWVVAILLMSFSFCHCFTSDFRSDFERADLFVYWSVDSETWCELEGSTLSQLMVSSKNSKPLSSKTKKLTAFSETSQEDSSLVKRAFVRFEREIAWSKPIVSFFAF